MIKVIACDMDGTLLNNNHTISDYTKNAIKTACEKGFRFMVVTGRNYDSARHEIEESGLVCDFIVGSGAEVRSPSTEVVKRVSLEPEDCNFINTVMKELNVAGMYCTIGGNYIIGSREEVENSILAYIRVTNPDGSIQELKNSKIYQQMWQRIKEAASFEELLAKEKKISKIFLGSEDEEKLMRARKVLENNNRIAVSWSSSNNLEITDSKAQKGPILKEYIESLGYTMNEVAVFGDSMNDYSMMSMDFGATIAMENADPEIKRIAKYVTTSNQEDGVAVAIHKMIDYYGV